MIIPGQSLQAMGILDPFVDRQRHVESGLTYGVGPAGYDVRLAEDVMLAAGAFSLASTVEHFAMPLDVIGVVHEKSTLARMGLAVQNAVIELGWRGYLTLELSNNKPEWRPRLRQILMLATAGDLFDKERVFDRLCDQQNRHNDELCIHLCAGQPIAQILFHRIESPVERPYAGRYQDQRQGPVEAIFLQEDEAPQ